MIKTDKIDVYIDRRHVCTLAETKHRAAFQYSDEWIETGYSISPFSLPLEKKLFIPDYTPFEGVYGVFADTLPDGWGRLIVDRYIKHRFKLNTDDIVQVAKKAGIDERYAKIRAKEIEEIERRYRC